MDASVTFQMHADLGCTDRRKRYERNSLGSQNNVHAGQRKLLVAEIAFLAEFYGRHPAAAVAAADSQQHPVLVYAGAAPGHHLVTLARLFPCVAFVLYDVAQFSPKLTSHKQFVVRRGLFDTAECNRVGVDAGPRPLLLVSDIRSSAADEAEFESQVAMDMGLQRAWVERMRPCMAMLKFRLPYSMRHGQGLEYLHGRLMFGVWAKRGSGESRLVVTASDGRLSWYDFRAYEESMAFHNDVVRGYDFSGHVARACPTEFVDVLVRAPGRHKFGFDRVAELEVLWSYLGAYGRRRPPSEAVPRTLSEAVRACADVNGSWARTAP